jgi:excisionase family DNA binding protein
VRRQTPEAAIVSPELRLAAEGFASLTEAGEYLRLSRATLYKMMDSGALAYARFGRSRRIPWTGLKDYAAKALTPASC